MLGPFPVISFILIVQAASAAILQLEDKDTGNSIGYGKITMVQPSAISDGIDVTVQANGKNKSFVGLECTIPAAAAAKEMGLSIPNQFIS